MKKTHVIKILCLTGFVAIAAILWRSSLLKSNSGSYFIGVNAPLTGPASQLGPHTKMGAELFIQHRPEILGMKLECIVQDNKSNPKDGVNAFQAMMLKRLAPNGMVITQLSGVAAAVGPIAHREQVLLMGLAAAPSLLESELSIRNYISADKLGHALADLLVAKGMQNASLLTLNDEYGIAVGNAFEKGAKGRVEITKKNVFEASNKELSLLVESATRGNPESVVVAGFGAAPIQCIQRLREVGYDGLIVCDPAAAVASYRKLLASEGLNYYVVDLLYPDPENPTQQDFRKQFIAEFGTEPDLPAAVAYSGLEMLMVAAERAQSTEATALVDQFEKGFSHDTLLGPTMVRGRNIEYPLCIKKVSGGGDPTIEERLK